MLDTFVHKSERHLYYEKLVLTHLLPNINVDFDKDEYGKPYLIHHPTKHISFSHSGNQLAVMIASKPCGIDIQLLVSKVDLIEHKFLSQTEKANIDPINPTLHRIVCWSAKEAIYKWYGRKSVDFIEHIQLHRFELQKKGTLTSTFSIAEPIVNLQLAYQFIGDYVLVFTI
jgi:phosphopantetheinyl transferase